jgi:hypothetical protein
MVGLLPIAVLEYPGEQEAWKRAERDLHTLSLMVNLIDNRTQPGEGVVFCLDADRAVIEDYLDMVDRQWPDCLEILDMAPDKAARMLHREARH